MHLPDPLTHNRQECADEGVSLRREWLVTNGAGAYASGTIGGALTRRYHALLVGATRPPLGRRVLLAQVGENVKYAFSAHDLQTSRWADGSLAPRGFDLLERFELDRSIPTWTYTVADACLEKRLWLAREANAVLVEYRLVRASEPMSLHLDAFVTDRDHNALTREGNHHNLSSAPVHDGVRIEPTTDGRPLVIRCPGATAHVHHCWHHDFALDRERERGQDWQQDLLHAVRFSVTLEPGQSTTLIAGLGQDAEIDPAASLERVRAHEADILARAGALATRCEEPDRPTVLRLAIAADQCIVRRDEGDTILAGYPWFQDWGRDAMIALPGLALATGRPEVGASILRTFAAHLRDGLIPNRFPDDAHEPAYNAVDATLWFVRALDQHLIATNDDDLRRDLFPAVREILTQFIAGTHFGVQMDPADALLRAGEAGVQLTWMDAKIGDRVITQREGKTVEVCALWVAALRTGSAMAKALGEDGGEWEELAQRAGASFTQFWNDAASCCFDVLDGPSGADASVRPNQIMALDSSLLIESQIRDVLHVCAQHLYTPLGLRTLDPADTRYRGRYEGDMTARDEAYHMGTAWPWLLGPYLRARAEHLGDRDGVLAMLRDLCANLADHGVGSLSEIASGDPPHAPDGCIAQAWSVGQALETFAALAR